MVQFGSKRFDFCRKCTNFHSGGRMRIHPERKNLSQSFRMSAASRASHT